MDIKIHKTKIRARDHILGIIAIVFASILWGTTGVSATFAPEVSPIAIGAAAMGIGGLLQALVSFRAIRRDKSLLRIHWKWLLLGAICVAIYPLAFYASMRLAGVTIGTVVSLGCAPLFCAATEMIMDNLRANKWWIISSILGITGMILICLTKDSTATTAPPSIIVGVTLGLIAALTYALYSWSAQRLMQKCISSRAAMGAMFGIGGLLLMPVLLITGAPFLASWNNIGVGIYMATVPMFLGYICFGYGLAHVRASTATTITLLEPVVAAILAALIVGERLNTLGYLGVTLIFISLVTLTASQASDKKLIS